MDKSLMYDKQEMAEIGRDCIEPAFCFIHQKRRVYEFSTNSTQRVDIEYAIAQYF